MRESISGLVGTVQKFQVLDWRGKASSRNHELSAMTGRGAVGERAKRGTIQGMLAKPASVPAPVQLFLLYPDPGRRMVPWKTEGHMGP